MSESVQSGPDAPRRRRSITERLGASTRGRGRSSGDPADDSSSVGGSSAPGQARRRRSRSPLRAASFAVRGSKRSIVGRLSKIAGGKKKKTKKREEAALALAGRGEFDDNEPAEQAPSIADSVSVDKGADKVDPDKVDPAKAVSFDDEEEEEEEDYTVELEAETPSKEAHKDETTAPKEEKSAKAEAESEKVAKEASEKAVEEEVPPREASSASVAAKEACEKSSAEAAAEAVTSPEDAPEKVEAPEKVPEPALVAEPSSPDKAQPEAAPADAPTDASVSTIDTSATPAAAAAIQVILLLMDPSTRRFELLQLEFDSSRARVNDVLAQIPVSATEEGLRTKEYSGVCDRVGKVMEGDDRLVDHCMGGAAGGGGDGVGEVVLAMPKEMTGKDCARLARPILRDPKVVAMLNPVGAAALQTVEETKVETVKLETKVEPQKAEVKEAKKAEEKKVEEKKVEEKPEDVAAPEPEKDVKATATAEPEKVEVKADAPKPEAPKPKTPKPEAPKPEAKSRATPATAEVTEDGLDRLLGVCRASTLAFLLVVGLIKTQALATHPLGPGDALPPGGWRSECGLLNFVPAAALSGASGLVSAYFPGSDAPEPCVPGALEMGTDGILRRYVGGFDASDVAWEAEGGVCADGDDACVPGLVVEEDGRLVIGGKAVKMPRGAAGVVPWPFTVEAPTGKTKRRG